MKQIERWFSILTNPWVIAIYWLVVVISYFYLDQPLALYLHSLNLDPKFPILSWITQLGSAKIYIILLLVLALICRYIIQNKKAERYFWFLWLCVFIANLVGSVFKTILGRARPEELINHQQFGFTGWHFGQDAFSSFPSGHVTVVTSLLVGLTVLFPRYCYAFLTTAVIVIITRVLLTRHYLSDVLATFYLVFIGLNLLFYLVRRYYPKMWSLIPNE